MLLRKLKFVLISSAVWKLLFDLSRFHSLVVRKNLRIQPLCCFLPRVSFLSVSVGPALTEWKNGPCAQKASSPAAPG